MSSAIIKKAFATIIISIFCIRSFAADTLLQQKKVLEIMEKVADWQLNHWETNGFNHPKWDWTNAAGYTGLLALGNLSKNKTYINTLISIGDSLNWETGPHRLMADDYCIGQIYALLYKKTGEKKMIANFKRLADSIVSLPHDESLEWKNNIQQREWAWCDALFMGPPPLAYLSSVTRDKKYLNTAIQLWWKTTDYLYDSTEHLYFRDGSFLDKKEKNGEKIFWSRGNGWVMAGLARMLENMPVKYPQRKRFIDLYKSMSAKIASLQQPDGTWHASLLDPASYTIKETSGTGFYCYALLWGLNNGILNKSAYQQVVTNAWHALVGSVHDDGMLGYVQPIGASPDKVDANSTEIYGVGGFLLAGSEMYKFLNKN